MKSFLKAMLPQKLKDALKLIRISRPLTGILGSPYMLPNHRVLQLDITYACNMACPGCNRSCPQAPDKDHMAVEQVEKFVSESKARNRRWNQVKIMGGEPTLHPEFFEILYLLLAFKKTINPGMELCVKTNNHGETVKDALRKLPKEVIIKPSPKEIFLESYYAFNIAPVDIPAFNFLADFSVGCHIPWNCGIGLNKYGYFPCGNGAGVSRVFGLDIGNKKLPDINARMKEELNLLCRYCGAYHQFIGIGKPSVKNDVSKTWKRAYERYNRTKPELSVY